ncbi:unnamed protein product, partial [Meganyctiphanes norvegica]
MNDPLKTTSIFNDDCLICNLLVIVNVRIKKNEFTVNRAENSPCYFYELHIDASSCLKFTVYVMALVHISRISKQVVCQKTLKLLILEVLITNFKKPLIVYQIRTSIHSFKKNDFRASFDPCQNRTARKPGILRGKLCVVLCDGFYEWQTTKGDKTKQPYLIYVPQPEGVLIHDRESWDKPGLWDDEEGWKGPQMLKMAGLFSRWVSPDGDEIMSYTVVTMESASNFSWLHHRVPAILQTQQEVQDWLDSGKLAYKEALNRLKPETELVWHPVSAAVGNSRNQDPTLTAPISLEKKPPPETPASKLMSAWLSKAPTKSENGTSPNLNENKDLKPSAGNQKEKKSNPLTTWLKKEDSGEKSQSPKMVKKEISNIRQEKDHKPNPLKNWLSKDKIENYNGKVGNESQKENSQESTSNNQVPSESERFPCPVCSENFSQESINKHLDTHF